MKASVLIATRERPTQLIDTIRHTLLNVGRKDTRVIVLIDEDDKRTLNCLSVMDKDDRLVFSVKPREDTRGEKYDRALTEAPADIYIVGHDCVPFLTPNFDQAFIDGARLFPDGIGCVYSPMANASFPAVQAPTAKLVEKIGWIYNRDYPFWFIDHELDDIARMIGRFTFVDVRVDTQTARPSKSLRLRDLAFWTTYFDAMTLERRESAFRIIDDLDAPVWQKKILKTQYPAIEARSLWINGQVRASAAQIESERGSDEPPDLGYLRAKAKAEKKLLIAYENMMAAAHDAA